MKEKNIQAIALWQPWATLLVAGIKKIETRSFYTSRRGRTIIHASKLTETNKRACMQAFMQFYDELKKLGYEDISQMPLGKLVGELDIIDAKQMVAGSVAVNHLQIAIDKVSSKERQYGHYEAGRYGWLTENHKMYSKPVPYVGQQGFFNVDYLILPR